MNAIFAGQVSTLPNGVIENLPDTRKVQFQCESDLTIKFWNQAKGDFGTAETLEAPGGVVRCADRKVQLSGGGFVTVKPLDSQS